MQLTAEQEDARKGVQSWLKARDRQVFALGGYAGTGKTTITKLLAEDLGGGVVYGAYTGKAAHVMARNGCIGATTIHRLIYLPKEKSRQELLRLERLLSEQVEDSEKAQELRERIAVERRALASPSFVLNRDSIVRNAKLIVVDEVSMVDGATGQDLLSFGVPLLVIGDPEQLPPVKGRGFFSMSKPDAMLTQIHRQAADNPIIRMATDIRNGKTLSYGDYGNSIVVSDEDERIRQRVLDADQLIVGLRASRATYNARIRELLGKKGSFDDGDKLVCLKNDHDEGLMNGSLWEVQEVLSLDAGLDTETVVLKSLDEDRPTLTCDAFVEPLTTGEAVWGHGTDGVQNFTYGYALTCHKAQGSQFDDVVVFDESRYFRENSRRWLYTAVTRACERVMVIQ